ncbi:MAG: hypothetical protein ABIV36_17320 [Sphingobium limneticum]
MSESEDTGVRPMATSGFDAEPGEKIEIFGTIYFYDRTDADRTVTFRPPTGASYGDFTIASGDGSARKPTLDEVGTIWAEGNLVFREPSLGTEARRFARAQQKDIAQAKAQDKSAPFRAAILRLFDDLKLAKSDRVINAFMKAALADPKIAAMSGARTVNARTFRRWVQQNGTEGCRKVWDSVSMKGRSKRTWSIPHPVEIVMYWAIRATHVRGDITKNYDRYVADIYKINKGLTLDRNFCVDPDGEASACERPAEYPVPTRAYVAISYKRFWRMCRSLKSTGYVSKTTRQAGYQLYGGGGLSDIPTHLGAFAWMDDTPIPRIYFVDDDTGVPIGQCTFTALLEQSSGVVAGWHLNIGAASSSSVLQTVLHANTPKHKDVSAELLQLDANLPWLRFKPAIIGFDNSTAMHGRSVEDVLGDAYIGTRFFGSEMARDKAHMERIIGTLLDLAVKQDLDANYDIARMRRYKFNADEKFNPKEHILLSVRTGRHILGLAAMTYNATRNKGKDGRQPALVWRQKLVGRKLDTLKDVDAFEASIGDVEFDIVMTSSGIEKFSRRYTPGAVEMTRIIREFDDGWKREKDDIGFDRNPNTDDRKKQTHRIKGKYDREDIGTLKVWNPYHEPPQWEYFHCTNPDAHGMPLWLHERCLELAKAEAMEYATPEQQSFVRARLFEQFAKVNSASAERERRAVAKAVDDPKVKRVFARYVHVTDEEIPDTDDVAPDAHQPAQHGSAEGKRKDAHIPTPRQKVRAPTEPVKLQPAENAPAPATKPSKPSSASAGKKVTDESSRNTEPTEASGTQPYSSRRDRRLGRKNDAPRNAGTHHQSADGRDQRGASAPRSTKTGEPL